MADLLDGILDAPDPEPEPGIEVSNEMAHLDAELDDGLGDLLDGIIDDEEEEPAKAAPEPVVAKPGEVAAAIADAYREDFHLVKDVEAEDVVGAFSTNDKAAAVLQAAVRGRNLRATVGVPGSRRARMFALRQELGGLLLKGFARRFASRGDAH